MSVETGARAEPAPSEARHRKRRRGQPETDVDEAAFQRLYGRWQPWTPEQVARFLAGVRFPWWIAGGWALEAAGVPARRHEDIDIAVLRRDVELVRERFAEYHLWEAHSGTLRPLVPGDALRDHVEQLWVRRDADHPWVADVLLTPTEDEEWLYKRDHRVRLPLAAIGCEVDGIRYLRPGIALLYKARLARDKDTADFHALKPALPRDDAAFLGRALSLVDPEHAWRRELRA